MPCLDQTGIVVITQLKPIIIHPPQQALPAGAEGASSGGQVSRSVGQCDADPKSGRPSMPDRPADPGTVRIKATFADKAVAGPANSSMCV
jgi:hypothetical protein